VLLDFGLATRADHPFRDPSGKVFGTMGYLAPERLHAKHSSTTADWYSVGVMLWEMLGGSPPANDLSDRQLQFSSRVPVTLRALCRALLPPDPPSRAGANEVAVYRAVSNRATVAITRSGETSRFRLVGRESEFQLLQACFRKTL